MVGFNPPLFWQSPRMKPLSLAPGIGVTQSQCKAKAPPKGHPLLPTATAPQHPPRKTLPKATQKAVGLPGSFVPSAVNRSSAPKPLGRQELFRPEGPDLQGNAAVATVQPLLLLPQAWPQHWRGRPVMSLLVRVGFRS